MYIYSVQEQTKWLADHIQNNSDSHVLTEEEKKEQIKKSLYSALCTGNKESIIKFLEDGKI